MAPRKPRTEETEETDEPTLAAPTPEPKTAKQKRVFIEADDEARKNTDGVDWDAYPRKYLN